MTSAERDAARLALGPAAVLTVTVAAQLMPRSDAKCRKWLRDHGLVRTDPLLGEVVIWGDVLEALRNPAPSPATRPAGRLPRKDLRGGG